MINEEKVNICKEVIYEVIFKLKEMEETTECKSERLKFKEKRLALFKALDIVSS